MDISMYYNGVSVELRGSWNQQKQVLDLQWKTKHQALDAEKAALPHVHIPHALSWAGILIFQLHLFGMVSDQSTHLLYSVT